MKTENATIGSTLGSEGFLRLLRKWPQKALRLLSFRFRRGLFRLSGQADPRALLPTIIFQPGKVGSSSVHASLLAHHEQMGISVPIYHAHVLYNTARRIEYVKKHRKAPARSIRKLREEHALSEKIQRRPKQMWNVINLVREPVAMKVSALFQVLEEYIPDWEARYTQGTLPLSELDDILFHSQEMSAMGLRWWYDNEIRPLWGIDVFSYPFDREKGYQVYRQGNINLIVIRLEDLNRVAEQAFAEFMGLKGFQIVNANIGETKRYAALYQQYKQRPLPEEYVDSFYETDFAKHFYTPAELQIFRKKWLSGG